MKPATQDNLARFFYDSGKVAFAVLVIGGLAKKSTPVIDFLPGMAVTLVLVVIACFLNETGRKGAAWNSVGK
ncbi:MAG: hypothetical protein COV76_07740 [Candidatus Omnitrophica bacterium CG11_big_fil_rev_8_21_14_0_20_64_10]|nr:MAG: hypothetical protein COV76_07740 [Candidatus Omnitrophica bacterium CG11_big_fil_rev_8_21_14_0_20_64_10]